MVVVLAAIFLTVPLCTSALAGGSVAPVSGSPPAKGPPLATSRELARDRGWPTGSIQEQLDRDPTLVPFGKGAVFVPAMTNPLDEPPVTVMQGTVKLAEGTGGMRLVLSPGQYQVMLGSGALDERISFDITVRERHTTIVPVTWSGLTVHVIDVDLNTLRRSYELIRMDDREYVGAGFGANEQAGEPVSTWILRPGLYKVVQVGDTYRARKNFATVRLIEGRHTHFNIVLDPDTGDFVGAGEAAEGEVFAPGRGTWGSLVLGGDMSLSSGRNAITGPEGETYALRAFLDTKVSIDLLGHPLLLQLQVEEGQTQLPDGDFQKTQDRADVDALYVYRWQPWLGPYVQLGAETNLLRDLLFFDEPRDVRVLDENGRELAVRRQVTSQTRRPALGLMTIKEGTGVNVRVFKTVFGEATIRLGVGGRHAVARGFVQEADDPETPEVEYARLASSQQFGVQSTLVAAGRFARWILLQIEVDCLVPFKVKDLRHSEDVVFDVDGTVSVKLTQYASLNYVLRYLRDRTVSMKPVLEQDLLLRFSLALP